MNSVRSLVIGSFVLYVIAAHGPAAGQPCSCFGMAPPGNADQLIIEMRSHSHFGGSHGWRVLVDGTYESLTCDKRTRTCGWKLYRKLSNDELGKLRSGLAKIDLGSLKDLYEPKQRVMDGASTTYWFSLGGKIKKVVHKAGADVAELTALKRPARSGTRMDTSSTHHPRTRTPSKNTHRRTPEP